MENLSYFKDVSAGRIESASFFDIENELDFILISAIDIFA